MGSHVASRRRREIGVRKTLGASTRQIAIMLLTDFSKPVIVANIIAWPAAYLAANAYLDVFIHRIALSVVPFVLSLGVTVLIAWAAVGAQAFRAARVKPALVLRYE
jgi:putative ABC transport system permease protein